LPPWQHRLNKTEHTIGALLFLLLALTRLFLVTTTVAAIVLRLQRWLWRRANQTDLRLFAT
jgi:hypothetical protein